MSAVISHAEQIAAFVKDQAVRPRGVAFSVTAGDTFEAVQHGFSPGAAGLGGRLQFEDRAAAAGATLDTAGGSRAIKISGAVGNESVFGASAVVGASLESVDHGLSPGAPRHRGWGELKDGPTAGGIHIRARSGGAADHRCAVELAFHRNQGGGGICSIGAAGEVIKNVESLGLCRES